jgi:predicted amidohydrolase YtcJ
MRLPSRACVCFASSEAAADGEWIVGGLWNDGLWGGALPEAAWIDAATPRNPVYLSRVDGHMALVNSAALHAAGVDAATRDPPGGRIHRDASGAPTGILACAPPP